MSDAMNLGRPFAGPPLGSGRHEVALGWYDIKGRVYITLDVAKDQARLAEVLNHEHTHHLLASTTPYGFLSQVLQDIADDPWDDAIVSVIQPVAGMLTEGSRFVQEAAATFSSIALLDDGPRSASVGRLPAFYRSGYDRLASLFADRSLDALAQSRLARVIGARAMQTSIMDDWVQQGLADRGRLARYLAEPANQPDSRFSRILEFLGGLSTDSVLRWCGRYEWDRQPTLDPAVPDPMPGLRFSPFPRRADARHAVEIALRQLLGPRDRDWRRSLDFTLETVGEIRVVLAPPQHGLFTWSAQQIDREWCRDADFIIFLVNALDEPMNTGEEHRLQGKTARLKVFRPDESAGRVIDIPIREVAAFVSSVPELSQATACISSVDLLPFERASTDVIPAIDATAQLSSWLPLRRVILYDTGDFTTLIGPLMLLSAHGREPWILHANLPAPSSSWGYILLRKRDRRPPILVHPTLLHEWDRVRSGLLSQFAIEQEPSEQVFLGDEDAMLSFLRFQRVFMNRTYLLKDWRALVNEYSKVLRVQPKETRRKWRRSS